MVNRKKWFDINKLSLNLNKTKLMIIGKLKKEENTVLSIDGACIERVLEYRFLCVILDDSKTWKSHITPVRKKISKSIVVLHKVKHVLDYKAMQTLYCALVLSVIVRKCEVKLKATQNHCNVPPTEESDQNHT